MSDSKFNAENHVTAVISHLVKPGREEGYEEWIKGIIPVAKSFQGHLGVNIIRPQAGVRQDYIIVLHFDNNENLQTWLTSPVRSEWIERVKPLIQEQENVQVSTGLESWYDLPKRPQKTPPKRYKMVLLTWLGVFVTLVTVKFIIGPLLMAILHNELLAQFIIVGIVVWILTYLLMPQLTKLCYKWLYPNS